MSQAAVQEIIQVRVEALRLALSSGPASLEDAVNRATIFAEFLTTGKPTSAVGTVSEVTQGETNA